MPILTADEVIELIRAHGRRVRALRRVRGL